MRTVWQFKIGFLSGTELAFRVANFQDNKHHCIIPWRENKRKEKFDRIYHCFCEKSTMKNVYYAWIDEFLYDKTGYIIITLERDGHFSFGLSNKKLIAFCNNTNFELLCSSHILIVIILYEFAHLSHIESIHCIYKAFWLYESSCTSYSLHPRRSLHCAEWVVKKHLAPMATECAYIIMHRQYRSYRRHMKHSI